MFCNYYICAWVFDVFSLIFIRIREACRYRIRIREIRITVTDGERFYLPLGYGGIISFKF